MKKLYMMKMKKQLFYSLALAGLLAGAGSITAASMFENRANTPSAITKADEADDNKPGYPGLVGECKIDGKEVYLHFTVTAPTQLKTPDWDYIDYEGKFDKLELLREGASYYDDPILIKEWTDVDAGAVFEIDDKDQSLKKGEEYTYYAVATRQEKSGDYKYAYMTLGMKPIDPDNPVLEPTGNGAPVTVKYTCPALERKVGYWDSEPMPDGVTYDKIILSRSSGGTEVELESHDNPTPGQEFSYIDNDAPNGTSRYMVKTITFVGESDQASTSIFLGDDYPGAPSNVVAVEVDGKVKVTWDAPTKGYNDGVLDLSKVKYSVYRKLGSYDYNPKLLSDNVTECEYIDDLADLTSEQTVYYRIIPHNDVQAPDNTYNYADSYTGLLVGPPAALPFHETFNNGSKFNKGFANTWTSDFAWDSFNQYYIKNDQSIAVGNETTLDLLAGVDGGTNDDETGPDAYFYVSPATYYETCNDGYLTSGNLTFANAGNPYATMYIVPINNSTGTVSLQISTGQLDDEGNPSWNTVETISFDDPDLDEAAPTTELKWKKCIIPMTAYAGTEKCKVRLAFKYALPKDLRYAMLFDDLKIDDYPAATDLSVERANNGDLNLTWSLPESAGEKAVTYNVYLNGEKVAETNEPNYTHKDVEQGESYSFEVEAAYGDITAPKTEPAVFTVDLTSFTVNELTYQVDGDNVALSAYAGSEESVTVPATVSYKEREFTVNDLNVSVFKGNRNLKSINIEANVTEIPVEFLYGCVTLHEVILPATVQTVEDKAFFGCAALESIALPSALATIGTSAFEHSGLKEVAFGENLTEIKANAFRYCSNLAKVKFTTAVPPTVGTDAFAEIANPCIGDCPEESVEAYANVAELSTITFPMSGINGISANPNVKSIEYFNVRGERIDSPAKGEVTIVRTTLLNGKVNTRKQFIK